MDEDFKDVTASSKKIGIILLIVIIGLAFGGYYFVFKPIYFSVRTIEIELGEELPDDVSNYLGSYGGPLSNYSLDTTKVDINTVGEYTYKISNGKMSKEGKIKVRDTEAPTFTLKEMSIEEGNEDYYLGDFLETCDDLSKPCLVTLKNAKDENKFSTVGTHDIEIEIADVYGNKKSAKATLNVIEKGKYTDPRSLDLEYASNSKGTDTFDGIIYKKLDKALDAESHEARDEMNAISTVNLEEYVTTNYPGYRIASSEIIALYNKSKYVIGYAIEITLTNGVEKNVYVDPSKAPLPNVSTEPKVDDEDDAE